MIAENSDVNPNWFDSPSPDEGNSDAAKKVSDMLTKLRAKQAMSPFSITTDARHREISLKDGSVGTITETDQQMLDQVKMAQEEMEARAKQEEQKEILRSELDK